MDRALRLTSFWNWLPAFRAVAETEHLPTAARLLHVTPSALSRSVRQLEAALGQRLFVRAHRRMQLSTEGREVLAAVRDAMRGLDDRLADVTAIAAAIEPLRVACSTPWLSLLVLPAVGDRAMVRHSDVAADAVTPMLLRGELDLFIGATAVADDRLQITRLGAVHHAVAGTTVTAAAIASRRFAIWTGGFDGWPPERARTVGFASHDLGAVIAACADGAFIAAVPTIVARSQRLRTAALPRLASGALYVIRRRPLAPGRLDPLVDRVTAVASAVLGHARARH